jgi:hypothetical protein
MDKVNRRERKQQRKEVIKAYHPSDKKIIKDNEERDRLIFKDEYYDIINTLDCFDSLINEPIKRKK